MFTKIQQMWLGSETADAEGFLARWHLTTTANGEMHIRSLQESISFSDVQDVVERLSRLGPNDGTRFIFDMSSVKTISSPWTAVFALFVQFARHCGRRCHLTAMSSTLRAMASLVLGGGAMPDARLLVD